MNRSMLHLAARDVLTELGADRKIGTLLAELPIDGRIIEIIVGALEKYCEELLSDGDVVLGLVIEQAPCPKCGDTVRMKLHDDGMHNEKCQNCGWYFQTGVVKP